MDKRMKVNLEELKHLYLEEGLSGREIADRLGIGKSTVLKWIQRMGISRPKNQHKDKFGRFIKKGQELPPPTGENHPRWKNGVHPRTYRRIAFEHHPNECYYCGSKENLHVHHKNKDRTDNTPENLFIVCARCHMTIEHREELQRRIHSRDELGRFT